MEPFAVISDLHGNLPALEATLDRLEGIDSIYVLGDLVGIGPQPSEVLDIIMGDERFKCVRGNHDHNTVHGTEIGPTRDFPRRPHHDWVRSLLSLDQMAFLGALPMTRDVHLSRDRAVMMHSHPEDCGPRVPYYPRPTPEILNAYYLGVEGRALFFGHTHSYFKLEDQSGRLYVNPGAVGAENDGAASFVIVSEDLLIERVQASYDIGSVREMISVIKPPNHEFILKRFYSS